MKTLVIRLKSNVFTSHDFYNIMSSIYFLLQESYNTTIGVAPIYNTTTLQSNGNQTAGLSWSLRR